MLQYQGRLTLHAKAYFRTWKHTMIQDEYKFILREFDQKINQRIMIKKELRLKRVVIQFYLQLWFSALTLCNEIFIYEDVQLCKSHIYD